MPLTNEDRVALERRASEILERRKLLSDPPAAVVVEFSGSPKAGKTTNIEIVAHFFKRCGFTVWAPSEGASKRTPYHLRRDLVAFNTWSLNYAISELLVAYHNVDRQDLIILDRGPFDSLAWMSHLRENGDLTDDEYERIERFALHPKWFALISRVYLFTCGADVSLKRELESKLTHQPGMAMNPGRLNALLRQYAALRARPDGYPVYPVDTGSTSGPLDTARPIAEDIMSLMDRGSHASS